MNVLKTQTGLAVLLAGFFVGGCSSTKQQEPVFSTVPGVSNTTASLETKTGQPDSASVSSSPGPAASAQVGSASTAKPELIITPDNSLAGTIVSVNNVGRFAVLQFPLGKMPAVGTKLYAYRQGQKVAELKVTERQKDDYTVADIQTGECRPHDEVRNQ